MSVTRKLYCRLTLGSFLTFKNALPPQDHLSSQDRQTHTFPLPSPPLLHSQWQSHRTSWSAEFKARMNNHLPLHLMFAKNKTECVCSGTCYQTQVEWMFPVRELAGVDWWEREACHKHNTTSLPSPSPDQRNSDHLSHLGTTPSPCHR